MNRDELAALILLELHRRCEAIRKRPKPPAWKTFPHSDFDFVEWQNPEPISTSACGFAVAAWPTLPEPIRSGISAMNPGRGTLTSIPK